MGDKIDFNAALEDCKRVRDSIKSDDDFQNADYGLVMYYLNTIVQALEIATTVKRGRWIDIGHNAGLKCSNCGKRIRYRNGIKIEITVTDGRFNHTHEASQNGYYNFCPKCGAKMDGGDADA